MAHKKEKTKQTNKQNTEPRPTPAKYWLAQYGLIDSAEVRLPMVEVSAELAGLLDEEIERRSPPLLRRA